MKLTASSVATWAAGHGLPIAKPATLKDDDAIAAIVGAAPDVMIVAAYGLLLPARVLAIPPLGCINIHASLLPRWRGAAPIQRALLAGDSETGISIMRMDAGLDTGPVLLEKRTSIAPDENAGSLTDRLAGLGAEAIVEALARIDSLVEIPQPGEGATYAKKITKSEAQIDWRRTNAEIDRQIRAFNPVPGAESWVAANPLKIWRAQPVEGEGQPGVLLQWSNSKLVVACGKGALELLEIQRPGSRRMTVRDYLRGTPLDAGVRFGEEPLASP
jgi:methionyl-tRNA formyltransferase